MTDNKLLWVVGTIAPTIAMVWPSLQISEALMGPASEWEYHGWRPKMAALIWIGLCLASWIVVILVAMKLRGR